MALTAEALGDKYAVTRAEVDRFALQSHQRATQALKEGKLTAELAPVTLKKGVLTADEHVRPDASLADMNKLRPSPSPLVPPSWVRLHLQEGRSGHGCHCLWRGRRGGCRPPHL